MSRYEPIDRPLPIFNSNTFPKKQDNVHISKVKANNLSGVSNFKLKSTPNVYK